MNVVPLKFRRMDGTKFLFADDAGSFFKADDRFLQRYVQDRLDDSDLAFLDHNGHAYSSTDGLEFEAFAYRYAQRLHLPRQLNYVILVPTLRCNLSCGYCQVSRVNENTSGHDWSEETLQATLTWLGKLPNDEIKVEFQGGEPLLRLDILKRVREFVRGRFRASSFVVCTNLQDVSEDAWTFLSDVDTMISTSLDATKDIHQKQRTITAPRTNQFFGNLNRAVESFPDRVSALPTIDPRSPPEPVAVIRTFSDFGFRSIFLRPINYQGFARKKFHANSTSADWNAYHARFIDALVEHNWTADVPSEEYYFTHCLRRVLRAGHDGHVDLRNPNIVGRSYLVVDYDGSFYPTDEARMITRVGVLDLNMGNVRTGLSASVIDTLNAEAFNSFDPDCVHCPYQAFCGVDLIDDLSRYGRIDIPKHRTNFCQRHTGLFDKLFEMIFSEDERVLKSMAIWAGVDTFDASLAKVHA